MNIIFLDIDGVLTSNASMFLTNDSLDKGCLEFFFEGLSIIKDVKIVISSAWRKKDSFKNDFCKSFPELAVAILDFLHEDWCTIGSRNGNRGEEISEWLSRHPETTKFVCVDDSSRGLESFPHIHAVPSRGFGLLEMRMMVSFFYWKRMDETEQCSIF